MDDLKKEFLVGVNHSHRKRGVHVFVATMVLAYARKSDGISNQIFKSCLQSNRFVVNLGSISSFSTKETKTKRQRPCTFYMGFLAIWKISLLRLWGFDAVNRVFSIGVYQNHREKKKTRILDYLGWRHGVLAVAAIVKNKRGCPFLTCRFIDVLVAATISKLTKILLRGNSICCFSSRFFNSWSSSL
ncbi:hypothetical protein PanWU01x14_253340 [Parasponia andersonii]|uniref:Uncharacterized protein n=1 Tax=Parasponia andersonii TaxID=3476 RepID=A0A2P5BBP7_PARAD|nr:hypothetical protein PanWU01x14_253340 [Parasponia andersonii]